MNYKNIQNIQNIQEQINKISQALTECLEQLNSEKKTWAGFSLKDSVIDVEEGGYGISTGNDILYTYGIDTCCGLVLCDDFKRVLFHLDGGTTINDVLKVISKMQFKAGVKVFIVPGAHKMKNNFDYIKLYEILQKMKYIVEVIHLPATFGFITVKKDSITIGSPICKEEIRTVPLMTKN